MRRRDPAPESSGRARGGVTGKPKRKRSLKDLDVKKGMASVRGGKKHVPTIKWGDLQMGTG